MFEKYALTRSAVALCLALCLPCQAMFAASCLCSSECNCQCDGTRVCESESQHKTCCCSECTCGSCDNTQPGQPGDCQCRILPLSGLPFSQQDSRPLQETLQVETHAIVCIASNPLDLSNPLSFVFSQNASCVVQRPCILFCCFLL